MKMRRVLALVMAVLMVIGLMPVVAAVTSVPKVGDDFFTLEKIATPVEGQVGVYDITVKVTPIANATEVSGDVEVVFLLDTSGSMAWCTDSNHDHRDSSGGYPCKRGEYDSRLKIAKNAIFNTISELNTQFADSTSKLTVSVATYSDSDRATTVVDKVAVNSTTINAIESSINRIDCGGATHMIPGLNNAAEKFTNDNGTSKYLIMIGDGDFDDVVWKWRGFKSGWYHDDDGIKNAASKITGKGVTLMTVGFTQDIAIFREIASKKDGKALYYRADTNDALNTIMGEISEEIKADGIVLNDYVGDTNAIVDTNKVKVSDGAGNVTVSGNSIKWDIPKDAKAGETITLKYQINVDPEKINEVGETTVKLNGDETTLSYIVDKQEKTIKVGPPTDTLTVGKLKIEYYFDDVKNDDMDETKSAFVTNDAKFAVNAPASEVTVGEDKNQKTYELEKALLNDSEYSFAADSAKIDVNDELQTLKIYYKEKTVEQEKIAINFNVGVGNWKNGSENLTKEFVLIKDATAINAPEVADSNFIGWFVKGNSDAEYEFRLPSFDYEDIKDLYDFYEPGTVNEDNIQTLYVYAKYTDKPVETPAFRVEFNANGGYWTDSPEATDPKTVDIFEDTENIIVPGVDKDNADFLGWYIKDESNNIHKIDFDKGFGYDTASAFAEVYPVYEIDGVKTLIVFAQYEENAEQTYTVTYEFVSDDPNAALPYNVYEVLPSDNGKYKKDDEVEIAQEPADVTFFGYTWTFLRWEINGEKVDAGSTQKMPEGGLEIVGIWTRTSSLDEEYSVTYKFESGTEGAVLPWNVNEQLPVNNSTYSIDQEVPVAAKPNDVVFGEYTWKFQGWKLGETDITPNSKIAMVKGGLEIVGIWTRTSSLDEEYPVTYKFESGTEGAVLPWNVNEQLPVNNSTYSIGQEVTVAAKPNDVVFGEYTWKFQGWKLGETDIIPNSKVPMVEGGLEFVGIWIRTSLQDEEYSVTYKYDENVPSDVKETLPNNPYKYKVGENVTTARPNPDVVEVEGYRWTFKAWRFKNTEVPSNTQIPMEEGGLTFVGIWTSEIITPEPPVTYYTVIYTDGVENEEVFADQIFTGLKSGETTPAFDGYLIRDGYTFAGWNPNVSETVTKNVTYTAQWKLNSDTPIDPPFIVIFPTLEISNKVIAPKNFEKTSFEYDIINVKTGDVEKSVTLKADSSVRVMVTGGTEYMVVPKNLDVPGYIVTTTSTPDSATVTSDKIGNVSVDFTHIYVVGLNTEDHYAYIRGYEDGTIRPEGNITRAEVATIFYRLLSSEALAAFKTTENTFTDVDSDAWYNLAVSTLAKAGVISGYPDGSFNPNGKITRAELVSIATRFFTTIEVGDSKFSDIAGHWAAKAIDEAYIKGIIKGYSDGTFRPDQAVTRAEAMKIVNGILGRPIDTCVLIEGIKLWPDVASDAWYYYVVAEATNAHRYELTTPEKWTEIIIDEIEY